MEVKQSEEDKREYDTKKNERIKKIKIQEIIPFLLRKLA
jgi:hypothetical protein